ncbi:MAG: polysaccharide deacetylase family protein [Bacteroidetes bacterium]|nr:polysaccharide deacetylase family protein [Bacteroidota bacterium]
MSVYQIPFLLPFLYPNRIWKGPALEQKISLTFDDGPVLGTTDWVVEELAKRGMKATFFMVGDNVCKHPALAQTVAAAGHQIGNHTYHHLSGWKTATQAYLEDVAACDVILANTLGEVPQFFRPPYGWMSSGQAKGLAAAKKIVMWNLLSYDFHSNLSSEKLIRVCTSRTAPGMIIVFHDQQKTKEQLKRILPCYLDFLIGEGYTTQLLEG